MHIAYVKYFDKNSTSMTFLVNDEKIFKKKYMG